MRRTQGNSGGASAVTRRSKVGKGRLLPSRPRNGFGWSAFRQGSSIRPSSKPFRALWIAALVVAACGITSSHLFSPVGNVAVQFAGPRSRVSILTTGARGHSAMKIAPGSVIYGQCALTSWNLSYLNISGRQCRIRRASFLICGMILAMEVPTWTCASPT